MARLYNAKIACHSSFSWSISIFETFLNLISFQKFSFRASKMQNNRRLARLLLLNRQNDTKSFSRRFSVGPTSLKGVTSNVRSASEDFVFDAKVEKYSAYQPTPVSMSHFIDFGRNASLQSRWVNPGNRKLSGKMKDRNLSGYWEEKSQKCFENPVVSKARNFLVNKNSRDFLAT